MPTEETAHAKAQRYGRNTVTQHEPVPLPSLGQRRAVLVKEEHLPTNHALLLMSQSCTGKHKTLVRESGLHGFSQGDHTSWFTWDRPLSLSKMPRFG